ncbi:MAG: hypothetical protein AABY01_03030, partial [Nanoarchaeota archaeon]
MKHKEKSMSRSVIKKEKAKPRIKTSIESSDLPKPIVFYDHHRRVFLLLTESERGNRYITIRNEELQVVKLHHGEPARDDNGQLKTQETTCVCELVPCNDATGRPYNLVRAAQKFWDSLLSRNHAAVKELCLILGKPMPEMTEEIQTVRKAAGERLKTVRALMRPLDTAILMGVAGAKGEPTSPHGKYLLQWIREAKKGITMEALYKKHDGRPTHVAVAKMIKSGL